MVITSGHVRTHHTQLDENAYFSVHRGSPASDVSSVNHCLTRLSLRHRKLGIIPEGTKRGCRLQDHHVQNVHLNRNLTGLFRLNDEGPAKSGSSTSTPPEPSPILGRDTRPGRASSDRERIRMSPRINAKTRVYTYSFSPKIEGDTEGVGNLTAYTPLTFYGCVNDEGDLQLVVAARAQLNALTRRTKFKISS